MSAFHLAPEALPRPSGTESGIRTGRVRPCARGICSTVWRHTARTRSPEAAGSRTTIMPATRCPTAAAGQCLCGLAARGGRAPFRSRACMPAPCAASGLARARINKTAAGITQRAGRAAKCLLKIICLLCRVASRQAAPPVPRCPLPKQLPWSRRHHPAGPSFLLARMLFRRAAFAARSVCGWPRLVLRNLFAVANDPAGSKRRVPRREN